MRRRRGSALAGCLAGAGSILAAAPALASGLSLHPLSFDELPGFAADDLGAALAAFRTACAKPAPGLADTLPPSASLRPACAAASQAATAAEPAAFFRGHFRPYAVRTNPDRPGLLTGYFEPELPGSLRPDPAFPAALLAMPEPAPEPFPDRAAIDAGALGRSAPPVVFLRDAVDAFTVHVQGSARIRLPDGRLLRVGFAGRNGHPYTAIGRVLADRLGVPPGEMPADRVWAWLRENPAEAAATMAANRSFIFFRALPELDPEAGPLGAAGVPLAPGRSLAVDRTAWTYGLPIWLSGTLPDERGTRAPLRRLVVAADTGAAIRGPERGDLFVGSGEAAGRLAGLVRDPVSFTILWPLAAGDPPGAGGGPPP